MFVTVLSLNHEHRDCCIKHTRSSVYDVIHTDVYTLGSIIHMARYPLTQCFSTYFFIRRGPCPSRFTRKYLSKFFKFIH